MTSIALGRSDVIVGVDTHKDQHVAVAINGLGGILTSSAASNVSSLESSTTYSPNPAHPPSFNQPPESTCDL